MLVEVNNSHAPEQKTAPGLSEDQIEDLLSEKLMEGYELIEMPCPSCTTPLIKSKSPVEHLKSPLKNPVQIPNRNPDKPFEPVGGVPLCVACNCHVVTQQIEMDLLDSAEKKPEPSPTNQPKEIIDVELNGQGNKAIEYGARREIATKVLGAKLLQGYVLKQDQCDDCGMPQMEYEGQLECVVCPVLTEKAKKNKNGLHNQQTQKREKQQSYEFRGRDEDEGFILPPFQTTSPRARSIGDFMLRNEQKARIEEEFKATQQRRREEEILLMEETKRLGDLEEEYTVGSIRTTDYMQRDLLLNMHRDRLAGMAKLEEDILKLEQVRLIEEMDARRVAELKRAEDEADMIKQLENEAARKQQEAEEAMQRAKAALEFVESAKHDLIHQTIEKAELEVVAEAEGVIKQEREEYKEPVILPTASEIAYEQWETLRAEARTVMTRRTMAGWTIIAEFCHGSECEHTPLIMKKNKKECVVCGGCGDGTDGAYALSCNSMDSEDGGIDEAIANKPYNVAASALSNPELKSLQDGFETKRDMVSIEIGKKMAQGWTLLDSTCPACVMPLMMDAHGHSGICVLCDVIATIDNESTDIPGDMPAFISTPRHLFANDPPASVSGTTLLDEEEVTISVPKGFDFSNTAAVMRLMSKVAGGKTPKQDPDGGNTVANHDIIDLSTVAEDPEDGNYSSLTVEDIAAKFMASAMGTEAMTMGSRIDMDEILDLVEIYVSTHFSKSIHTGRKRQIADAVWRKMQTSTAGEVSTRSRSSALGGPPKPESRSGTPRAARTPRTTTPKAGKGSFFFEGLNKINGSEDEDDNSVGQGSSRSFSTASMSLDNILTKIENCKATLMDDDISVDQQVAAAELIEKLSKAALAVKNLEDMDV